jgi:hypothetical protein
VQYLQTLPCYTLYHRYGGQPPIAPAQLQALHHQILTANAAFKAGVDEDWRRSCMEYPKVLDYYFQLVDVGFPGDGDDSVRDPVFSGATPHAREQKRVKQRRDSMDTQHRKKERRRSRGRTPPPVPMAGNYRR